MFLAYTSSKQPLRNFVDSYNEMVIGINNRQEYMIKFDGVKHIIPRTESLAEIDRKLLGWNKHCFTWKTGEQFKVCSEAHIVASSLYFLFFFITFLFFFYLIHTDLYVLYLKRHQLCT